jgi:8-oxo-dGTP pyrophosphatase MutT (NUDIX family)
MSAAPDGKRQAKAARPGVQYAALPYRRDAEGLEILLVTSRETRRWVIPKGWPMKGRKPRAAAAREALEEAGVVGLIAKAAVGAYPYMKRLKNGALIPCLVRVFPLQVGQERETWPEMAQRERRWFAAEAAAQAVDEPELAELIRSFAAAEG